MRMILSAVGCLILGFLLANIFIIPSLSEKGSYEKEVVAYIKADGTKVTNDDIIADKLYRMTYPKESAQYKQDYIPMTHENIELTMDEVRRYRGSLKHYETYMSILLQWSEGNFNNYNEVHKKIK